MEIKLQNYMYEENNLVLKRQQLDKSK